MHIYTYIYIYTYIHIHARTHTHLAWSRSGGYSNIGVDACAIWSLHLALSLLCLHLPLSLSCLDLAWMPRAIAYVCCEIVEHVLKTLDVLVVLPSISQQLRHSWFVSRLCSYFLPML
jgi:hypothetical protein